MANSRVRYGAENEYYYKDGDQWYQKSIFFLDKFVKRSEDQVPAEYVRAERLREKSMKTTTTQKPACSSGTGTSGAGTGGQSTSRLISFLDKDDVATKKRALKQDNQFANKQPRLNQRMEGQKKIMIYREDDAPKADRVKKCRNAAARVELFEKRLDVRCQVFAAANLASLACERRPEYQQLLQSSNINRQTKGQKVVSKATEEPAEFGDDDFFHIEDLTEVAAKKNVTVVNTYMFLTVNTLRGVYFNENGCVYCAEHNTAPGHTQETPCPHINCSCCRCYAMDLIKPDNA